MNNVLLRCCCVWLGAVACVGPARRDALVLSTAPSWWQPTAPLPVASSLRGLAAVDRQVAWVGGADGALWRTVDGGASWQSVAPANEPAADFRDVHAFDLAGRTVTRARARRTLEFASRVDTDRTW